MAGRLAANVWRRGGREVHYEEGKEGVKKNQ